MKTGREAQFVIKNKGNDDMKNVFIRVKPDSTESYTSEKVDIPGKGQKVIKVKIPDELYHQKYEFNYTRLGETTSDDYGTITENTPVYQSFVIEQLLDTVWINIFYVKQGELNSAERDRFNLNFDIGNAHLKNGDYDSAILFYKTAMQIDPTSPSLHFNLCILNSDLHQYERALIHIETAIDYGGAQWQYLNSKSYVLGELDRYEHCVVVGLESLNLNPNNIKTYGNLIKCFDELQKGDSVLKYVNIVEQKFGRLSDWMSETKTKYVK